MQQMERMAGTQAREVPLIERLLIDIGHELDRVANNTSLIEAAHSRLVNPTPKPVAGDSNNMQPKAAATVESHLRLIMDQAQTLANRLTSLAGSFDSAI